jgi:hypothetical protein
MCPVGFDVELRDLMTGLKVGERDLKRRVLRITTAILIFLLFCFPGFYQSYLSSVEEAMLQDPQA